MQPHMIINLKVANVFISIVFCTYGIPVPSDTKPADFSKMVGTSLKNVPKRVFEENSKVSDHGVEIYDNYVDRRVADALAENVRILCWVLTAPLFHKMRAQYIKATWGKRCNIILFMSTETDDSLPTVALDVKEGYEFLWGKTKEAFRYVHKHYRNKADWFLKADDDTYVVVENLRLLLSNYETSDSIYFGCRISPAVVRDYMSGGAGYVMSRASLDKLVTEGLSGNKVCERNEDGGEDALMGACLENLGVTAMDTRDALGRATFNPLPPIIHMFPDANNEWFFTRSYYPTQRGMDCCSDYVITFHKMSPQEMFILEYFIYHVKPYGIRHYHLEDFTKPTNYA